MGDSNVTMSAVRMFGVPFTVDFSLEPFMFVGSVVHNPLGTIRFMERVGSFDMVVVPLLVLMLMIVGMGVVYPIFKVVVGHLVRFFVTYWLGVVKGMTYLVMVVVMVVICHDCADSHSETRQDLNHTN